VAGIVVTFLFLVTVVFGLSGMSRGGREAPVPAMGGPLAVEGVADE
jgi:hypothetical protein